MKYLVLTFLLISFLFPYPGEAHPGRTASDGCHYCRTNCDRWGAVWNERHCHNGYVAPSYAPQQITTPTKKVAVEKTDYTKLSSTFVTVTGVIDGDTVKVKFADDTTEKVRLLGIDTPEKNDSRKTVECFSKEASEYLKTLIGGKPIELKKDKSADNRDKYKRLLRYAYTVDGEDIDLKMIKDGYAYALTKYRMDAKQKKEYKNAENEAKKNQYGLWAPNSCNGNG